MRVALIMQAVSPEGFSEGEYGAIVYEISTGA